jgi:hypothetical protein
MENPASVSSPTAEQLPCVASGPNPGSHSVSIQVPLSVHPLRKFGGIRISDDRLSRSPRHAFPRPHPPLRLRRHRLPRRLLSLLECRVTMVSTCK